MTRFQTAFDRLASRLQERDGRSVSYTQASTTLLGITAVPCDEDYLVSDGDGGYMKIQSNDWIVKVSDLQGIVPKPGDQISETRGTESRIYEVMPIDNRPAAEEHDSGGVMLLIHSKRIQ